MTPSQLQPGSKWGHATITAVSSVRLPQGEKRPDLGDNQPWVRAKSWQADRIAVNCSIPPRILWPNGRSNHWKRAKAVKCHRETMAWCVAGMLRLVRYDGPWARATIQAAFFWPNLIRRDEGNAVASLKAYIDGLVDGGLLEDDSTDHLRHLPVKFDIDRKAPHVALTIERSE